jgi:hypothetical protein
MVMMADSDAIQRLRERLETGWQPQAGEINRDVPQTDALNWEWSAGAIVYQTVDRQLRKTGPVIYIDEHMTYALTSEGIFWLYGSEESEKVRWLGG